MQNTQKRHWIKDGEIFGSLFSKKILHFGRYGKLPKFSRLDPAYHNIELYDQSVNGMSIRPRAFAILSNIVIDFQPDKILSIIMYYVLF